jgi:hypothetical protein
MEDKKIYEDEVTLLDFLKELREINKSLDYLCDKVQEQVLISWDIVKLLRKK